MPEGIAEFGSDLYLLLLKGSDRRLLHGSRH